MPKARRRCRNTLKPKLHCGVKFLTGHGRTKHMRDLHPNPSGHRLPVQARIHVSASPEPAQDFTMHNEEDPQHEGPSSSGSSKKRVLHPYLTGK
jgi:hypothetical protein